MENIDGSDCRISIDEGGWLWEVARPYVEMRRVRKAVNRAVEGVWEILK